MDGFKLGRISNHRRYAVSGDEKQGPGLCGGYSFTGYEDVAAEESCVQSAHHVSYFPCARKAISLGCEKCETWNALWPQMGAASRATAASVRDSRVQSSAISTSLLVLDNAPLA